MTPLAMLNRPLVRVVREGRRGEPEQRWRSKVTDFSACFRRWCVVGRWYPLGVV